MRELNVNIEDLFIEKGISYKENSSGELLLDRCYNCGRSNKLYVHKETGAFICFRCNEKGGPVKLIAKTLSISFKSAFSLLFGSAPPENITEDDIGDLAVMISGIISRKSKVKSDKPSSIKWPDYIKPLREKDRDPMNYLLGRGLTPDIILKLKLRHWEFCKRVVFPVEINGELMGYLARDYTGKQSPKVLNSRGNFRSHSVWNYDNVKESPDLVICEGVVSAIKCGINRSIALLGKVATEGQIDLIKKLKPKRVYICLDVGTDEEQLKIYQQLCIYFPGKIYKVDMPKIKIYNCDSCKSKIEITDKSISCENCGAGLIESKVNSAEYKDAGDYSFDEIDRIIISSKRFPSGPLSWT
jgi:hypothetical protein